MLRAILLYLSKAAWARKLVCSLPFASRAAARFVAGDTWEQALHVIQSLNDDGLFVTIDHLGENTTTREEAQSAADTYLFLLQEIKRTGIKSSVSLKLTQIGLNLDPDLCWNLLRRIVQTGSESGIFVRIDMEDSGTVDRTLDLFYRLRSENLSNVGLVIQSYLYRSFGDTEKLLEIPTPIRLVKGAYNEPPEIAYRQKSDTDTAFDQLTSSIIRAAVKDGARPASADGHFPPITALGTHDEKRIEYGIHTAQQEGLPKSALEIQMLHGIRPEYQRALAKDGFPVRVYVPYGTEWYPYFTRRLAERPANIWFILSNFFKR
ncbi:MAG: proline dehydrogenase family protein [Anaerolineales bacterium]|nr:proline dehydrogenase family protein [Anaerolineales bacterium]